MRPTHRLLLQHTLRLQQTLRLTLFTRENCSLCTTAKSVLGRVWDERPFEFREVDVMKAGQERWKALYEYDTPVVRSRDYVIRIPIPFG
jgi:glutaredoxin